jgi:hypothetical protein
MKENEQKEKVMLVLTDKVLTALNTDKQGCAVTLTTAHHYAGNITHPRQGFREMGVLIEYK